MLAGRLGSRGRFCQSHVLSLPRLPDAWRHLSTETGNEPPDGLPPAQLAKALLCGNSRAQLTTVRADAPAAGTEPKVTSSLVQVVAPRGYPPLVLMHPGIHGSSIKDIITHAEHPASLCYGATDPPGLLQRYRPTGWLPPRVIFLGRLSPLKTSEVSFQLHQAAQAWRGTSLVRHLPPAIELENMVGFAMHSPSKVTLVDVAGTQRELEPDAVDAAMLDPLAYHQLGLLRTLAEDPEWQDALRLFCAAYLGVEAAPGAFATATDRFGLTVLAREASQTEPGAPWRHFRFAFQKEMKGKGSFMEMLRQMRQEVEEAAAG